MKKIHTAAQPDKQLNPVIVIEKLSKQTVDLSQKPPIPYKPSKIAQYV
jgi:hypothetical protein